LSFALCRLLLHPSCAPSSALLMLKFCDRHASIKLSTVLLGSGAASKRDCNANTSGNTSRLKYCRPQKLRTVAPPRGCGEVADGFGSRGGTGKAPPG